MAATMGHDPFSRQAFSHAHLSGGVDAQLPVTPATSFPPWAFPGTKDGVPATPYGVLIDDFMALMLYARFARQCHDNNRPVNLGLLVS